MFGGPRANIRQSTGYLSFPVGAGVQLADRIYVEGSGDDRRF